MAGDDICKECGFSFPVDAMHEDVEDQTFICNVCFGYIMNPENG